jgi:DNA modification methylase
MFGNNNFLQCIEMALVLAKGNPRFRFGRKGGRQPRNLFESPQVAGAERVKNHDGSAANLAQKPLGLTELWIRWASKPGDWVLDAFAGTGTATVKALQLGRHGCAVERDLGLVHQVLARVARECRGAIPYEVDR